jgi:sugar (pentulose or hexulose) kinase
VRCRVEGFAVNAIGIDVGTTGLKAVAVSPRGEILRERTVRYPTRLAGLGAEQDARAWWKAATEALPGVVAGEPVGGVAVTCQAPTLVCVGSDGEPLGQALTWIDRRASEEADEISEAIQPTRNPSDPYFATAKLLWLARNRPEEIERADAVLCVNGFLVRRLTGESTFDETTAGLFQGWDGAFDPALSDQLAGELAVDPSYLVRLFKSDTGLPPIAFLNRHRAELAANLLLRTELPIAGVGERVGWSDPNYFARRFKAHFGMSATAYRIEMGAMRSGSTGVP